MAKQTPREGVQAGRDLMVFVDPAGGTSYQPTAAATSHSIDHKADTKTTQRITKDTSVSLYTVKKVTSLSCTIQVEALKDATASKLGYDKMLAAFKKALPVKCKYGYADETAGDSHEEGLFIITALGEKSPADADATWSATLESTGEISTVSNA